MRDRTHFIIVQRQELLHVGQNFGDLLRVLGDAAQLLLIEVRRDLFTQQYLADDAAQIRWTGAIFWYGEEAKSREPQNIHTQKSDL